MARRGKWTKSRWRKELDKVFSLYIRQKYADDNGYVSCYTCGNSKHWKEMHCGHYVSRSYLSTRFDENNVRCQDYSCNMYKGGDPITFRENLVKEIGEECVLEIEKKRHEITHYTIQWYKDKVEHYTQELKNMV